MWKELKLILWKNLVIRKRHWLLTFTEILIPILLFTLVAYGRSKISGMNKVEIDSPSYHDVSTEEDIYSQLAVGELDLWYTPYNDFTYHIMRNVQEKFQIPADAIKEFNTKKDLLMNFRKNCTSLIAAIVFNVEDKNKLNYDLSIYDKYFMWNTDKLFVPLLAVGDTSSSKYLYKGFAALQLAIDNAYLELFMNKNQTSKIAFSIQEFPDPPHTEDSGLSQLFMYFLPLITLFSFIFLCPAVLQRVGEEKQSGTKEFMKMVGMKSWMLWLGWFIHALITNLFSIVAVIILMKVPFWGVSYPPIEFSDGTVLFVFLFLYCMAAVTFCFLIATIFNTPSIATVVGILLWIFSYFIPQTLVSSHESLPWKSKVPFAIFPNMALYYGYSSISVYEMREIGIQWYNMFQSGSGGEDDVTMGNVFVMLIFDTILFMLLTLYIETVQPGEYGIAKPYNFPLVNFKNFIKKCCTWTRNKSAPENIGLANSHEIDVERGKAPCIQIRNLIKKYYNNVAVNNLNMDIYEKHITVLLGHNGAGKTTTMSILTGMVNASHGSVEIYGKNIKEHTNEVRKLMGLCPQHNLLFPDLTVGEHLQFFAMLRGSSNPVGEAKKMLAKFDILDKENDMACALSGGMKRKLCLGMALIGESKVLILDEPTSGMDPESRRKVWDLLLECRKTKTIFLTTHFMEEADVLGDMIAIMANGHLQCYDTPIRLKMKYNTGYHLSLMLKSKKSLQAITNSIKGHILEAELLRESDDTVVYLLPLDKKLQYRKVFNTLEENKSAWQIITIGLNLTTLNDVFLKAKDELDGKEETEVDGKSKKEPPRLEGIERLTNCFCSMITKRLYFLRKKFYWYIPAIIVSISVFLLTIWLGMSNSNYNDGGPQLNLNLQAYGKPEVFYGGPKSVDSTVSKMRKLYAEAVLREGGSPVLQEDVSEGIIQRGTNNIAFYKKHMVVAAEFNESLNKNEIIVNSMYSTNTLHGLPISINLAMNAVVKTLLGEDFSITTSNSPLKPFDSDFVPTELSLVNVATSWLILIPISMLFFMSNFIIFPNLEVSTQFMQIQTMAGIKTYFYWLTNQIFDFIFSIFQLGLLLLLVYLLNWLAYDSIAFKGREICAFTIILTCYIWTSLPFTYLLSYRKTITGGFTVLLMFGMFIGIIPTIVIMAMEFSKDGHYMEIAKYLKHIFFLLSPQFSLSYICVKFSRKYVENFNWRYMDPNKRNYICEMEPNPCCNGDTSVSCNNYEDYFKNEKYGIKWDVLEMLLSFIIYFVLLLFLNTELFKKVLHYLKYFPCIFSSKSHGNHDECDGEKCEDTRDDTLRVRNLTKSFGRKEIVKNLKLQLKKNKCFGLLGVNGAGKTTTFRILSKLLFFDNGDVKVLEEGNSIPIKQAQYSERIGYCPQEDCFNYYLTGEELLKTVARLKGYSEPNANKITEHLLKEFGLMKYASKPCLEYSGGNKRKLSSCLAFLGSPNIILLDEPTSGVDPASRRKFWKVLSSFKKNKGTSFLLCSHSMEECENLCDEIAIMKNGEIKDQGSLLALKNKYQKGFKIEIKLKCDSVNATSTKEQLKSILDADLQKEHAESLEYKIEDSTKRLSELFGTLEELKQSDKNIEDYIISQISLEDIFLSVAEGK